MTIHDRIVAYISKCPPAISGSGGHPATFTVACALVNGFALSETDALLYLSNHYNPMCQPQWSETELVHKIRDAAKARHDKPRGHLLGRAPSYKFGGEEPPANFHPAPKPAAPTQTASDKKEKERQYDLQQTQPLPKPIEDGTRTLLKTAFLPNEGIRIVNARLNDEGRELPAGEGPTLSREEWLRKLDRSNGDPNSFYNSTARTGIYIAINPLKPGCSKDADVTNFRHCLVEFDNLSIEEQWLLYTKSDLPCTAVIHSGGKSLHAWVKVDASNRKEYDERVKAIYAHFESYGLDGKNKNPSRLSRLPNCVRFDKRQELIALNIGAPSFTEWLTDKETESIGEEVSLVELRNFKPDADPNNILGKRWLCKGSSLMIIGQSGIGKSSLAMQCALMWAVGKDFYGVRPVRQLKSLIIQHENDKGDLAEMFNGVMVGTGLNQHVGIDAEIDRHLVIIRERAHTGAAFLRILQKLIDKHRPDLVWIDPLYTYIGDDISQQKVCAQFLCDGLGPITEATGVTWMLMHHTGKPPSDPKSRKGRTSTDKSYDGLGSSILTNWIRATITVTKATEEIFECNFGKRGKRAGSKDKTGTENTVIYLKHSTTGICWEISDPPPKAQPQYKGGRDKAQIDVAAFVKSIQGEYFNKSDLIARAAKFADISESTIRKNFFKDITALMDHDTDFDNYTPKKK